MILSTPLCDRSSNQNYRDFAKTWRELLKKPWITLLTSIKCYKILKIGWLRKSFLTTGDQLEWNKGLMISAWNFVSLPQFQKSKCLPCPFRCVVVTDGPWDMCRFMVSQCKVSRLPIPSFAKKWCNIRKVFGNFYGTRRLRLVEMLFQLGMWHTGFVAFFFMATGKRPDYKYHSLSSPS